MALALEEWWADENIGQIVWKYMVKTGYDKTECREWILSPAGQDAVKKLKAKYDAPNC